MTIWRNRPTFSPSFSLPKNPCLPPPLRSHTHTHTRTPPEVALSSDFGSNGRNEREREKGGKAICIREREREREREMVVFVLRLKADVENVEEISFPEHAQWCINLKQSDGDEVKEGVYVSSEEEVAMSGSRGVAHFVMKFPGGSKEVSLNVQQIKGTTRAYTLDDSGSYVPIVAFECRGWYESTSRTLLQCVTTLSLSRISSSAGEMNCIAFTTTTIALLLCIYIYIIVLCRDGRACG